eukprot:CAMPEP_0201476092 /NCGR_PEP_ID=MMETSP0151_2-20130828/1377_1 /ASSEMBLY_ACC=CAM_ASM_000257 /TAXON_ID=200890 /ORGANISM="Paramoeba atlantica, Strain 621/1 / CCAP 1560/9" /LENGTH=497 /DNA_ID=CAMNT_0047856373 /DNA_START=96 /DNA_END=1589 /DNA_ORIENTATION=+
MKVKMMDQSLWSKFVVVIVFFQLVGNTVSVVQRTDFPRNFVFGVATAAYQIEGAVDQDGRGPTTWDKFSHTEGKVSNGDNGDVADDHYHRVAEDIELMKSLGIKNYRFSLAWSRIMPTGRLPVNPAGVAHYNREINALLDAGIEPYVTLFHWDLPLPLEDEGGWLSESIVEAFKDYAEFCFQTYGDRVKNWITINEPRTVASLGYDLGYHAPGRCSDRSHCPEGDSSTEPYIAAYNMLNAHAAAGNLYLTQYKPGQQGSITMTLDSTWAEPLDPTSLLDHLAARRQVDFFLGWFADPLYFGDWPSSMKFYVGDRLPEFTPEQKRLLKNSHDYFGLNHYTTYYCSHVWQKDYMDSHVETTFVDLNGTEIGPQADSSWLHVVPWGFRKLLNYVHTRYGSSILVTENGVSVPDENSLSLEDVLNDTFRLHYYQDYLENLALAIQDGAKVRGYFAWSLMDNFEWGDGYSTRFGMTYVDYENNQARHPKRSAEWYRDFLTKK